MYLLTVLAFAFVLWLPDDLPIQPLVRPPAAIVALLVVHQIVIGGLACLTSYLTARKLDDRPHLPQDAQHVFARNGLILRVTLITTFIAICLFTDWIGLTTRNLPDKRIFGAKDFLTLLPFLAGVVVMWTGLFPGDRAIRQVNQAHRIRQGESVRPLWSMGGYLIFHLRNQLLIVALPMTIILAVYDGIYYYGPSMVRATGMLWLREALLGVSAGAVFLFAPLALRYIWSTERLPDGPLREQLLEISRQVGLKSREILVWRSEGLLVNAAVMGIVSPLRYVILSDGLLESLSDEETKAVFGHEAGHVKLRHMEFFLLFAMTSMFLVGGVVEGTRYLWTPPQWAMDTVGFALIVLAWGAGFGWISRRFERQADLFGARCIATTLTDCDEACVVHHNDENKDLSPAAVCRSACRTFAGALYRVAQLNGIPAREPSWRHSSIESRAEFLLALSADPATAEAFDRVIGRIKAALLAGSAAGLVGCIWFYWPLW